MVTKHRAISELIRMNNRYSLQLIHCSVSTTTAQDELIKQMYEDIARVTNLEHTHYIIVTGDLNAKIWKREPSDTKYIGNFRLGIRNNKEDSRWNFLKMKNFCV